jgi:hypothetical protein
MAWMCGCRVEVASIRPSDNHAGVVIHQGDPVDPIDGLIARRNAETYLGRFGMLPVPTFPTELRRRAEVSIMVSLAGDLGEELAGPRSGYLPEPQHEQEAIGLASEVVALSDHQRDALDRSENRAKPGDEAHAYDQANALTRDQLEAIAHVAWLRAVTRNIVFSNLFADLVEVLVPVLLQHEVLAGEHVMSILDKATEKYRHLRVVAAKERP